MGTFALRTETQKRILEIVAVRLAGGIPPTVREIAAAVGIGRSMVQDHLDALEEAGYIQRERGKHRSIQLPSPGNCPVSGRACVSGPSPGASCCR